MVPFNSTFRERANLATQLQLKRSWRAENAAPACDARPAAVVQAASEEFFDEEDALRFFHIMNAGQIPPRYAIVPGRRQAWAVRPIPTAQPQPNPRIHNVVPFPAQARSDTRLHGVVARERLLGELHRPSWVARLLLYALARNW
jgi:hypothetical protein